MKRSSLRVSTFIDRVRQCLKIATAAIESRRSGATSELMAGISRRRAVYRVVSSQALTSRAVSVFLTIIAMLATMSVCSAQSIELAELTDEALQIDGTVVYVNGANLGGKGVVDRVTVEEDPQDPDCIRVIVKNAAYDIVVTKVYEWASLEAVIVTLGAGEDHYNNDTFVRDIVYGGAGDDVLSGGDGVSWLYGEGGEDELNGGWGFVNDIVDGGDDSDTVSAGDGDDILIGGKGDDYLECFWGTSWLFGGDGADTLKVFYPDAVFENLLFGEAGDDTITGGLNDFAWGGPDNDTITAGTVYGGDGDDMIYGTWAADVLVGEAGNDTIEGLGGSDFLNGGSGFDQLYGEYSFGAGGATENVGIPGGDVIYGGPDSDNILGQDGNDTLYGDDGDDIMVGGPGNDTLRGGNNHDWLYGNSGVDTLYGNAGNDTLAGGDNGFGGGVGFDSATDTLWGNAGADKFKTSFKPGVNPLVWEDIRADFNAGQGDTTY